MSKIMITTCDICGKKEEINLTEHEVGTFDSLWNFQGDIDLAECKDEFGVASYPQTWSRIDASFWTRRCTRQVKLDICPECSKKMLFTIEPENFNSCDPLYELFQIKKDKETS